MTRIAIFASGSGSNFQAILEAINRGKVQADVCLLVCDKLDSKVITRAEKEGVPTFSFLPKSYESKLHYETAILKELKYHDIDWLILAGYMRLVGPTLLEAYEGKIVNIHPSLLPAFPGKDAIGQALKARVRVTGVTVHFVDAGMDTGLIIDQQAITVENNETYESLQLKIQTIEHLLYPKTIQALVGGGYTYDN